MQYFMLFRGVLSGATQGVGSVKKLTPPLRDAIFYVILRCSFWSEEKKLVFHRQNNQKAPKPADPSKDHQN